MKSKFNIGDKVDFVNDYGVLFEGKTITGVESTDNGYKYQIEPTDTPWVLKYEKNLHLAGTYKAPNLDLELFNGSIAKFKGYDDWSRKLYQYEWNSKKFTGVYLDERVLYSITKDYGEPDCPLREELQPKPILEVEEESFEDAVGIFEDLFRNIGKADVENHRFILNTQEDYENLKYDFRVEGIRLKDE